MSAEGIQRPAEAIFYGAGRDPHRRLGGAKGKALTVEEIAKAAGVSDLETVFKVVQHLAANPDHGVRRAAAGATVFDATYVSRR